MKTLILSLISFTCLSQGIVLDMKVTHVRKDTIENYIGRVTFLRNDNHYFTFLLGDDRNDFKIIQDLDKNDFMAIQYREAKILNLQNYRVYHLFYKLNKKGMIYIISNTERDCDKWVLKY
jgi:hypothetical protein